MRALLLFLLALGLAACGGNRTPPASEPEIGRAAATAGVPRYGDADPHDWAGRRPWDYPVHGIDVSKWQGEIDWAEVRRAGIAFAFIKATEGGDLADERFLENWQAARRAGIPRGAYHYYYFCRTAREQARWFAANVPRDRSALPPVLDMEWTHTSRACPYRPPAETVRSEMKVWLAEIGRHYRMRPVIYTTVDFYADNELWRVKGYEFWLRSVAGHPSEVYPGQDWTFWQYTGTGLVPGIAGKADINAFRGSPRQWQGWVSARR